MPTHTVPPKRAPKGKKGKSKKVPPRMKRMKRGGSMRVSV